MKNFYRGILVLVIIGAGIFLLSKYSPAPEDGDQVVCTPTPKLTEGPYYKSDSPERNNLREVGVVGQELTITGYVYDKNCQVIANAWLDFWQADGNGEYDNVGYKLRGHQFTDENGKYILETVIPGEYPGRAPHIHVKLKSDGNSPTVTTQLYLPNKSQNLKDSIFNPALVMDLEDGSSIQATFNFVF